MWACIVALIVPVTVIVCTCFKNPDKLMSQIPGARAIAYLGVIALTFTDVMWDSNKTEYCLAAAVIMTSVFEIGSYARDKYQEIKKKRRKKASN